MLRSIIRRNLLIFTASYNKTTIMKIKLLTLPLFLTLLFACTGESQDEKQETGSIIGSWQLIEVYGSDGGNAPTWTSVENSYQYTFNKDGTFFSDRFNECTEGEFSVSAEKLILKYNCDGFTAGIESPEGTFVENFKIENGFIFLSPTYLNCVEGCENKFERIDNLRNKI